MIIKYGIVAVDKETEEVLHFVGYTNKPKIRDFFALREELNKDPSFDLMGRSFTLEQASQKIMEYYKKELSGSGDLVFDI